MRITDTMVLFWGGPFSQWHRSTFTIDGQQYNCAEQYMMAMKAKVFGDQDALDKILKTKDPAKQKSIGRTVKNFDPNVWGSISKQIVFRANVAKFSDPHLYSVLMSTGDKEIVEASPYDKIWGIGLAEDNPDALDKSKWQGTNWLGEVLMDVRQYFRAKALTEG